MAGLYDIYHFQLQESNLKTDSPNQLLTDALLSEPHVCGDLPTVVYALSCALVQVAFAEQQIIKPRERKSYSVPQDPLFPFQWSLVN